MEQSPPKVIAAGPGKTFWFGAAIFWLFIFAEIFDEVRHGHENLFILFGTPLWLGACALALTITRLVWTGLPHLTPCPRSSRTGQFSVLAGALLGLLAAYAWAKSPLFVLCYDSIKWMLALFIAGPTLGLVWKRGGTFSVVVSLLKVGCCVIVTVAAFFLLSALIAREDIWQGTFGLSALGVPFTVAVSLFDCAHRTRALEATYG